MKGGTLSERVTVTGIDMSIGDLVVLFLKVAIAAIPAMIVISIVYMVIGMIFMAAFWPRMPG
jgi:hypothetical protein